MQIVIRFLKRKWIMQLAGVIGICALLWFAGPLVSIADRSFLVPVLNRLLAIMFVVIFWLAYNLVVLTRANKTDEKLISALSAPQQDQNGAAITESQEKEMTELRRKLENALQLLKKTCSKGKRARQYLYELPWYVIVGAPGSGKTTLLLNSGLKFPLSETIDHNSIQGVGGTRNCNWLFTEEAVFLDTAGRYTTQDSHQAVDASAWLGFLNLIKKYRQRRPINGVLLTLSVPDLLGWTEVELRQNAQMIRQRVDELYRILGIRFPIYMLITKCDLIAGFTEFFDDMGRKDRDQIWGDTFSDSNAEQTENNIQQFREIFDELLNRLDQRTLRRIQEERDIRRRGLVLDFPQQMAMLKPAIMLFLQSAFNGTRYDEVNVLLRGIYFTSGTQEGTPIDRVMGRLAQAYGLDRQKLPIFSGSGKSYFINNVLNAVIFPEAELAGLDLRVVRRQRWLQGAAFASMPVFAAAIIALWLVSYSGNKFAIHHVEKQLDHYEAIGDKIIGRNDQERHLLKRLDLLHAAIDIHKGRPWVEKLGFYQGDKLKTGTNRIYEQLLKKDLLPIVKTRLELRIRQLLSEGRQLDLDALYEILKLYLMLGFPEKMTTDETFSTVLVRTDWQPSYAREPKFLERLTVHIDYLSKLAFDPQILNDALIAQARGKLNDIPLTMQIYTHLKNMAFSEPSYDFHLKNALGPEGSAVFSTTDGKPIEAIKIPGLYTSQGYKIYFQKQGLAVIEQVLNQNWVLNNPTALRASNAHRLYDDLENLYFAEYEKRWRQFLNNLKIKRAENINQAIQFIDQLAGPETPLRPLLEAVQSNTCFSNETIPSLSAEPSKRVNANVYAQADSGPIAANMISEPARRLESHFQELNTIIRSVGETPAPLDRVLLKLNELRDFLMLIRSTAKSEEEALKIARESVSGAGDVIRNVQMEFSHLPDPFKKWVLPLTSFSRQLTLDKAKLEIKAKWNTDVLASYKASLYNRYPLFGNSGYDARMADFCRFFAPDGIMDRFFQDNIKPFVDTTQSTWRLNSVDNSSIRLSPEALAQFQYAAQIQKSFFTTGGSVPSVQFELKPVFMDERIVTFRLNMEGQTTDYSHGPIQPQKFEWPGPQTNMGVRVVFLTIDGLEINRNTEGPWAWLKMLDAAEIESTDVPDLFIMKFQAQGLKVLYEVRTGSVYNPFRLKALQHFRCPESL